MKAEAVMEKIFHPYRLPRSEAYKAGCLAAIRRRLESASVACPYAEGTAEADAFFAGVEEGYDFVRHAIAEAANARFKEATQ